jgi:hypothetical protein
MSKLLVAAVAVGAIAAFNLAPQPAQARHCSMVTATAPGVTQGIATTRLNGDSIDTLGTTLVAGASEPAPGTPARVGGWGKTSAHPVKARL